MSKSLETVINGEVNDLSLHNNLTLVYCAFPGHLPLLIPHPQQFLLSLAKDGIWPFQGVTQFSWVSPCV